MAYSGSVPAVKNGPHEEEDDSFERELKEMLKEGAVTGTGGNNAMQPGSEIGAGMTCIGGTTNSSVSSAYRPNTLPTGTHGAMRSTPIAPG